MTRILSQLLHHCDSALTSYQRRRSVVMNTNTKMCPSGGGNCNEVADRSPDCGMAICCTHLLPGPRLSSGQAEIQYSHTRMQPSTECSYLKRYKVSNARVTLEKTAVIPHAHLYVQHKPGTPACSCRQLVNGS